MSVSYYIRLEQGHARHPSDSVLKALADALRLTPDERAHLHALAVVDSVSATQLAGTEQIWPGARRILDLLQPPSAALVISRVGDALGWNAAAAALFPARFPPADGADERTSNHVRYVFESPAAKRLFVNWGDVASDVVAHLRAAAGHHLNDPALRRLVVELSATSTEFATRWARRDVATRMAGRRRFDHPVVGRFTVDFQVLGVGGAPNQWLIVYSAEPGSPDLAAMLELVSARASDYRG
nr:DNA-binding protein [Kibdelosporangium sp. MJ126-NF4]